MTRDHLNHTAFYTTLTDTILGEEGVVLEAFLPEVPVNAPERELRRRAAVAGTFLAGLELTREGTVAVQQETTWAPIQVRRGQEMHPVS